MPGFSRSPIPALIVLLAAAGAIAQPQPAPGSPPQPPPSPPVVPAPADRTQYWIGLVQQPIDNAPDITVLVALVFDPARGAWTGTMDVPPAPTVAGAVAIEFSEVSYTESQIRIVIPNGEHDQNVIELTHQPGAATASGFFIINNADGFPMNARRISAAEASVLTVPRPQLPRPPYPYRQIPVDISASDGIALSGTLTIPEGPGPFPAAILVDDMSRHDRDRTDALHKPFQVLADRLTRNGIAVLRTDERGTGASHGDVTFTPLAELVRDTRAMIATVSQQEGIDPKRIGLIGFGEGTPIAARAGAEAPQAAFLVLLSPQGLSGADQMAMQIQRQLEAQGEDPAIISQRTESRRALLRLLASTDDEKPRIEAIVAAMRADMEAHRGEWADTPPAQIQLFAEEYYRSMAVARVHEWLAADPAAAYKLVLCPSLVIAGDLDLVCTTQDSVPPVEAALRSAPAGKDAVTVRTFPRVSHMLQPSLTGTPDDAIQIRTTIAPEILDAVSAWIKEKTTTTR